MKNKVRSEKLEMKSFGREGWKKYFSLPTSHFLLPRGFTFIELVIVFALIGVLTSVGIASYSAYNSTQSVQSGAADIDNLLRNAKSRAVSQVKPSSCGNNSLTGYQVDFPATGQEYSLSALCGSKQVITTKLLPTQVSFANGAAVAVFFAVSSGTVAQAKTINISGYGKTRTITVSTTGSITIN